MYRLNRLSALLIYARMAGHHNYNHHIVALSENATIARILIFGINVV
jgi:hypothetical protein